MFDSILEINVRINRLRAEIKRLERERDLIECKQGVIDKMKQRKRRGEGKCQ